MAIEFDTIAAISTPPGEGGIGIVRLSGDEALEIAEKVYKLGDKRLLISLLIPFIMGIFIIQKQMKN